ncbi:MAG: hypothetical protein K6G72_07695 [Lachnospiraceae bacterium]|nr:hypothetical protein [Lachnospiraceae bacterium]
MESNVFALFMERETSQACRVIGVWKDKSEAIGAMKNMAEEDELYSSDSRIDVENGIAQSDPTYSEEVYSDYRVDELELK